MRPYRGERIDNGERVYGNLIIHNAREAIHEKQPLKAFIQERDKRWTDESNDRCWTHLCFEVIPETVGQQTGLKDKNGKDLDWWENDIVKDTRRYIPKKERTYKIIFKQGSFWLKSIHGKLCLTCECLTPFLHIFNKIGTVHDNPELLK